MKKLATLFLLALTLSLHGQWDSCGVTNGLNNPTIQAIDAFTVHQGRLHANTYFLGLIYSDDWGSTWQQGDSTLWGTPAHFWEAHNKLYVSTTNSAVIGGYQYYSTDNGNSWTIDTAGMPRSPVNANYPATVIGAREMGDYIFYNFNTPQAFQWRHKDSTVYHPDQYGNINQLSGFDVENDTLWGLLSGQLQYLVQPMGTYTPIQSTDLPILASTHVHKEGRHFYIAALDANLDWTLYRSQDHTATWDTVGLQSMLGNNAWGQNRAVTRLYTDGEEIYLSPHSRGANTRAQIMYSSDRGSTWRIDSTNLPMDPYGTQAVRVFQPGGAYLFAAMNFKDVYRLSVSNIGVDQESAPEVTIFPNPASELVRVHSSVDLQRMELLSYDGRKLLSQEGNTLNVAKVPTGSYILVLYQPSGVFMIRTLHVVR